MKTDSISNRNRREFSLSCYEMDVISDIIHDHLTMFFECGYPEDALAYQVDFYEIFVDLSYRHSHKRLTEFLHQELSWEERQDMFELFAWKLRILLDEFVFIAKALRGETVMDSATGDRLGAVLIDMNYPFPASSSLISWRQVQRLPWDYWPDEATDILTVWVTERIGAVSKAMNLVKKFF